MKTKRFLILCIIVLIGVILFSLFAGVVPVFSKFSPTPLSDVLYSDKGTYIEGEVNYSTDEYYTITHSVNGIIPIGYEHYYLLYNEDFTEGVFLRADANWADNFDDCEFNPDGVKVSGVLKKLDYDMAREVYADLSEVDYDIAISAYYIDGLTDRYAVLSAINIILAVGIIVIFIIGAEKGWISNIKFVRIFAAILFVTLCLSVHLMSMLSSF